MAEVYIYKVCERWVVEVAPLAAQVSEIRLEVVCHHLLHDGQVLVLRLQQHQPAPALAPGPPAHLRHHREGVLVGAEVGIVEHGVGVEYAHHRHAVEVESLRDHLCADEYVRLSCREVGYYALVCAPCACRVEIHARHARAGEYFHYLVLHLLRPEAPCRQFVAAAVGAAFRHAVCESAVVARQLRGVLVVGQRHVAVLATRHPSALPALHHRREAPAVLEQYHLLAVAERGAHCRHQLRRECPAHHPAPPQVLRVNDAYLRHRDVLVARGELGERVFPVDNVLVGLGRRCRRSEQCLRAAHRGQHYRRRPCVVSRRGFLLLERCLVFLVDNDKAEPSERQEHGGARPEDNVVWHP